MEEMHGARALRHTSAPRPPPPATPSTGTGHPVAPRDHRRSLPIPLRQLRQHPWLLPGALALAVVLGAAAAVDGGRLLPWDSPVTDGVVGLRSPGVDRFALWMSRLGSTPVVIAAGMAGVVVAARRCRTVALVMVVAVVARPPVEWLVKEVVARPRPSGARLVAGTGFAYPSGHVLAAAVSWGFVPVIAGLYVERRWVVRVLSGVAWTVIGLIAWSRVWLGVHWASDVIGGLAVAVVALGAAETVIERRHHPDRRCRHPAWPH